MPSGRTAALLPEFVVKDMPLGQNTMMVVVVMMMMMMSNSSKSWKIPTYVVCEMKFV